MSKLLGDVLQWIVDLAVLNTYRGYTLDEGLGGLDTSQLTKLSDGIATGDVSDSIHSSDVGKTARPDHLDGETKSNEVDCSVQSNNLNQKVQPSKALQSFRNDHVQFSIPLHNTLLSNEVDIVQTNTTTPIDSNHSNTISDSTLHVSGVDIPNIPIKTKEPKSLSIFGVVIPSFPRTSSSGKTLGLLDVPELSRTTTRESSFGTSARSPERIYAFTCPSCGNTGLCGCNLRAGSLHSNRKKDFGFCVDTEFEQTYYPPSKPNDSKNATQDPLLAQRRKNNAWQGYRSMPDIGNHTPPLSPTDPQSTGKADLVKRQQCANEDGMVGLGCYRFAKDASKEEIINNTIEKLGDLAPLASNLAVDGVKVYGYKDITYDDILRKKYEREFPDRSTPYEKHLTQDGTTVYIGFPGGVAQQRDDKEHLRFHTWIDHIPSLQEWQLAQWRHSGRFSRDREPTEKKQEPPKQEAPKRPRRQQHVRFADQAVADAKIAALLGTAPVAAPCVVPSLGEGAHPLAQRAAWRQHLRQPVVAEEQ